ncbi:MAG: 50S ribosomal protein L14e [Candidatus Micrarchaeia archaeon]
MLLQPGRICIKKLGRDAGSRAVITSVEKDGFVKIITAERSKERRCNPSHLEMLNEIIDIKNKEAVAKAIGLSAVKNNEKNTK